MTSETLRGHYVPSGMRQRIDAGLQEAGLGSGRIEITQLAALDQFHSRGLEAVRELALVLGATNKDSVLDLGSGLGGPARFLAATAGCHVTGVELMEEYVEISRYLSERTGLSDRVTFTQGDAADLQFDGDSFDHAWTIHVSMNIRDKEAFYRGVHRVLRRGGRFAMYDVLQADNEPPNYPLPWSPVPETSFLATRPGTSKLLAAAGFDEILFEDDTHRVADALGKLMKGPPPDPNAPKMVTLPQAIGPQVRPMLLNLVKNLQEKRLRVVRAVFRKG